MAHRIEFLSKEQWNERIKAFGVSHEQWAQCRLCVVWREAAAEEPSQLYVVQVTEKRIKAAQQETTAPLVLISDRTLSSTRAVLASLEQMPFAQEDLSYEVLVRSDCSPDEAVAATLLYWCARYRQDLVQATSLWAGASDLNIAIDALPFNLPDGTERAKRLFDLFVRWASYAEREFASKHIACMPPDRFSALLLSLQLLEPQMLTVRYKQLLDILESPMNPQSVRNPSIERPIPDGQNDWRWRWAALGQDWETFASAVKAGTREFVLDNSSDTTEVLFLDSYAGQFAGYWIQQVSHYAPGRRIRGAFAKDIHGEIAWFPVTEGGAPPVQLPTDHSVDLPRLRWELQEKNWPVLTQTMEVKVALSDLEVQPNELASVQPPAGFRFASVVLPSDFNEKLKVKNLLDEPVQPVLQSLLWRLIRPNQRPGYPMDFVDRHCQSDDGVLSVWSRSGVAMAYLPHVEKDVENLKGFFEEIVKLNSLATDLLQEKPGQRDSRNNLIDLYASVRAKFTQARYRLLKRFWESTEQEGVMSAVAKNMHLEKQTENLNAIKKVQFKLELLEIFIISFYAFELFHVLQDKGTEGNEVKGMWLYAGYLVIFGVASWMLLHPKFDGDKGGRRLKIPMLAESGVDKESGVDNESGVDKKAFYGFIVLVVFLPLVYLWIKPLQGWIMAALSFFITCLTNIYTCLTNI
jgi:hypothetical protein